MERKIQRHDKIGSLGASMEVKRTTMDAAGASTGPRGNDTDEDDDNDDESLGTSGAELPQPGKVAATEGDSGEPDKYAKLRREKRLAMNRESARNRRKQKQVLIKSLEEQVAELRKTNQQYQITIESLSSKNRTLENELTMSRITIAQLSNANAGIAAPQQHHLFGGSLIPHHQQPLQLQQIPTSLEQTTQTNLQQQQQHQQHTLFSTIGTSSGAQNVFDSVFSNQTPLSMAMTGALMSNNESNTNTQDSNYFFQTTTNPLPTSLAQASGTVGANVSTSTEQPQPSTSANRAVATSSSSSTSGVGNNLSRLLQAQRDHMSMHRGSAISGGSMYTPEPVGTPMFTQTWDVPTSMDDSLFGTVNMGPAISNWQGMQQPNVMRNIETDTAIRGNLTTTSQSEIAHPLMSNMGGLDEGQNNMESLDSTFSRPSFDTITRSDTSAGISTPETAALEGYSYQQQVLDDLVRQRNIEDFIRYRNGRDHEPQPLPMSQAQPSPLQQQQFQQQQLQLQIQQQILQQQQQQLQLQIQPRQRSQSDYTQKSEDG